MGIKQGLTSSHTYREKLDTARDLHMNNITIPISNWSLKEGWVQWEIGHISVLIQARLICVEPYDLEIHSNKEKQAEYCAGAIKARTGSDARLSNIAYEYLQ